jgi:ABC-type branched-subunit amino acid transport system substrate-binding protein
MTCPVHCPPTLDGMADARLGSGIRLFAVILAILVVTASAAGASTPRKKVVPPLVSNTVRVVVPRGQPIQIAFASDSGFGGTRSLAHAIQMAVDNHGGVLGFPIRINAVDAATCGSPPNTVSAATGAAYKITANLQNVAVLGQVCSHGFAQALAIYQKAKMVVVSGSATNTALPAAGPTVFNRTVVDDNLADWYAAISQLPSDLAWRLDYTVKFGAPPSDFADLYYDAASIVLNDIAAASQVDAKGELIVNRSALAAAIRTTTAYPGVTCSVTIDPATGDRTDDEAAIRACAA